MNPSDAVSLICEHQNLVTAALVWLFGAFGASALNYFPNLWKRLPTGAQVILHLLATNVLQAVSDPAAVHGDTPKGPGDA
jgi:hypothetical protein